MSAHEIDLGWTSHARFLADREKYMAIADAKRARKCTRRLWIRARGGFR